MIFFDKIYNFLKNHEVFITGTGWDDAFSCTSNNRACSVYVID